MQSSVERSTPTPIRPRRRAGWRAMGVDADVAVRHGAVNAEVTEGLAAGLADHFTADLGVAITGYAGPTGGSARDPVGTVYIALFRRNAAARPAARHVFAGDRTEVKLAAFTAALRLIEGELAHG